MKINIANLIILMGLLIILFLLLSNMKRGECFKSCGSTSCDSCSKRSFHPITKRLLYQKCTVYPNIPSYKLNPYYNPSIRAMINNQVKSVVYIDWDVDWSNPANDLINAVNEGFNVLILAFWAADGTAPADAAGVWCSWSNNFKQDLVGEIHKNGACILVSAGGATGAGTDGIDGTTIATWAKSQYLDGVDFDIETGFVGVNNWPQSYVDSLVTITNNARNVLGETGVITHAPLAAWFGPVGNTTTWVGPSGGYTGLYQTVGNNIDWFNIQYYNQGDLYTDYNSLFVTSGSQFPFTSISEINKGGVDIDALVVGKPALPGDADSGYVDSSDLSGMISNAQINVGWNSGIMTWMWHSGGIESFIQPLLSVLGLSEKEISPPDEPEVGTCNY